MNEPLTVADFFCGAGGFSEGFHQAGFKVIFGLDNWKPAIETHDLNHPFCKSVCIPAHNVFFQNIQLIIGGQQASK